jgi:superfamily II DNA or RNA helicase
MNSAPLAIQGIFHALANNEERNSLIFDDILHALDAGRSPVVTTERTAHLEALTTRLERFAKHLVVLRGGLSEKQRREAAQRLASIPETEERVIVATGRYLGEGFDDARLDTLFLTMPIAWKGALAQYAGRLHRLHHAKREVAIYDYVDDNVPVLARMAAERRSAYRALGYRVGADTPNSIYGNPCRCSKDSETRSGEFIHCYAAFMVSRARLRRALL